MKRVSRETFAVLVVAVGILLYLGFIVNQYMLYVPLDLAPPSLDSGDLQRADRFLQAREPVLCASTFSNQLGKCRGDEPVPKINPCSLCPTGIPCVDNQCVFPDEEDSSCDPYSETAFLSDVADRIYLGDVVTQSLDAEKLPITLKEYEYLNSEQKQHTVRQSISFSEHTRLEHFRDGSYEGLIGADDSTPTIGFAYNPGDAILTYELDFVDNVESKILEEDLSDIDGTTIEMFGKKYFVADTKVGALPGLVEEMTLFEKVETNEISLDELGYEFRVQLCDSVYEIAPEFVSENLLRFRVNGELTPTMYPGDGYLLGDGAYLYVVEINFQEFAGAQSTATVAIGKGKVVIRSGEEVQYNFNSIDGLRGRILRTTGSDSAKTYIDAILLEWTADDETFIAPGVDLSFPVFGEDDSLYFSAPEFYTPNEEETVIRNRGDTSLELFAKITDGSVNFDILYSDNSETFDGIGRDSTNQLLTAQGIDPTLGFDNYNTVEWFVASWKDGGDAESYLLRVVDVESGVGTSSVKIRNLVTGNEKTVNVGDSTNFGNVRITLNAAEETLNTVTLSLSSFSGMTYANKVFTEEGMEISLPVACTSNCGNEGDIQLGTGATKYKLWIHEASDQGVGTGEAFKLILGFTDNGLVHVDDIVDAELSNQLQGYELGSSDTYEYYLESEFATRIELHTEPAQDYAKISYHGGKSYGDLAVHAQRQCNCPDVLPTSCVSAPQNMIGWWRGNGNTDDLIGDNNGQAIGAVDYDVGKVGDAFAFNGGTVQIPNEPQYDVESFTIDAWVRYEGPSGEHPEQVIFLKGETEIVPYGIILRDTDPNPYIECFAFWDDFTGGPEGIFINSADYSEEVIPVGEWKHITCTYDHSTSTGQLYVDGTLIDEKTGDVDTSIGPSTNNLYIGGWVDGVIPFNGAIDEVELFDRALTQPEIRALHLADSYGKCLPQEPAPYCGDNICQLENDETCASCPEDCGSCSFIPGTEVMSFAQDIEIQNLKEGDVITSYNEWTGEIEPSTVQKIFAHLASGYLLINGELGVTQTHPLFINGEWKAAGVAKVGDVIKRFDGEETIMTIQPIEERVTVYNLNVDNNHNFFAEGYLAHNKCDPECGACVNGVCCDGYNWCGDYENQNDCVMDVCNLYEGDPCNWYDNANGGVCSGVV